MTTQTARASVLSTFGALAIFYFASIALTIMSFGTNLGSAFSEPTFAWSFALRVVGGFLSLLIVGLTLAAQPRRKLAATLAWVLVAGVLLVTVTDNVRGSAPVALWAIAATAVALHLWGAACARVVARHEAF